MVTINVEMYVAKKAALGSLQLETDFSESSYAKFKLSISCWDSEKKVPVPDNTL